MNPEKDNVAGNCSKGGLKGQSVSRGGVPLNSAETQEIVAPWPGLRVPAAVKGALVRESTITENLIHGQIDAYSSADGIQASIQKKQENEKYKKSREIARGGMGVILDAQDLLLRRNVAMKVILAARRSSRSRVLRFVQEAQVTAQLQHPGVMPIYELGVDRDGNVYYTMKRVTGKTLKEILAGLQDGRPEVEAAWPLGRLLNVLQRVCDTIAYAHSRGVVHRDLKPENIMVGDYGEVLVLDWGLAKIIGSRASAAEGNPTGSEGSVIGPDIENIHDMREQNFPTLNDGDEGDNPLLTTDGNVIGTPGYMSPEQARGESAAIDERSDIYALGAILYHIIMRKPPIFWDRSLDKLKVLEKIRTGSVERPPLSDSVPGALVAIAMKAMALNPNERYQTAKECQNDIEAFQAGFVTSAENWSIFRIVMLFVLRHRVTSGAVLLMFLLLVIGLSVNYSERLKSELAEKTAVAERIRAVRALEALKATTPALVLLSDSYAAKQDLTNALKIISQAVDLAPGNSEARLKKAGLLQVARLFKEAAAEYARVLELDPTSQVAEAGLGLCRQLMETDRAVLSTNALDFSGR